MGAGCSVYCNTDAGLHCLYNFPHVVANKQLKFLDLAQLRIQPLKHVNAWFVNTYNTQETSTLTGTIPY